MKLLITSDLHIGARPSVFSKEKAAEFSASKMLEKLVEFAIVQQVDALLFAGDLIDEESKYFEAICSLEAAFYKLSVHGIEIFTTAGNHDYDVLPKIAKNNSKYLHVLGEKGVWERSTFKRNNITLQILGWSFPEKYYPHSPIISFPKNLEQTGLEQTSLNQTGVMQTSLQNAIKIALVHGDLTGDKNYAPIKKEELRGLDVDLWIIGHYHRGEHMGNLLLPGSPQGMDFGSGEIGLHGPWIAEIKDGKIDLMQIQISPILFDELHFQMDEFQDENLFKESLFHALMQKSYELKNKCENLEVIVWRIWVRGKTSLKLELLEKAVEELKGEAISLRGFEILISEIFFCTQNAIDINMLAEDDNLLGVLATLLKDDTLLEQAAEELSKKLQSAQKTPLFSPLVSTITQEECKNLLKESANRILEKLLEQKNEV